jgi:hypothetical protein
VTRSLQSEPALGSISSCTSRALVPSPAMEGEGKRHRDQKTQEAASDAVQDLHLHQVLPVGLGEKCLRSCGKPFVVDQFKPENALTPEMLRREALDSSRITAGAAWLG